MSSVLLWTSTATGRVPQVRVSWRAVRAVGLTARMGAVGRKRAMARAVAPDRVEQMTARAPTSRAARQAAAVMALVTWRAGGAEASVAFWSFPSRPPQAT
jgi:hypothetical protein